jgi:hypothetical protein
MKTSDIKCAVCGVALYLHGMIGPCIDTRASDAEHAAPYAAIVARHDVREHRENDHDDEGAEREMSTDKYTSPPPLTPTPTSTPPLAPFIFNQDQPVFRPPTPAWMSATMTSFVPPPLAVGGPKGDDLPPPSTGVPTGISSMLATT